MTPAERARIRALVYLNAVLPLVRIVAPARPGLAGVLSGRAGRVDFVAGDDGASLSFGAGAIQVHPTSRAGSLLVSHHREVRPLTLRFGSHDALCRFFAGKPALPMPSPWLGVTHLREATAAARLLSALRVLEPGDNAGLSPAERALRVRLLLTLVASGLSWLHRAGLPEMSAFAAHSPERVYQWTVEGSDIATWLRVREGRVHAGAGTWSGRTPFVHFVFADVDAAFAVLTATDSQMTTFRGGAVRTWGSPEYTRKLALLMQKLDELLVEG